MTNSLRAVRAQQGLCIVAAALVALTACGGGASGPPVAQTNPSAAHHLWLLCHLRARRHRQFR